MDERTRRLTRNHRCDSTRLLPKIDSFAGLLGTGRKQGVDARTSGPFLHVIHLQVESEVHVQFSSDLQL